MITTCTCNIIIDNLDNLCNSCKIEFWQTIEDEMESIYNNEIEETYYIEKESHNEEGN